jgi:hypothetical protein
VITTLVTVVLLGLHPTDGPVRRDAAAVLPAVAVDQATGPMATRTLLLTAGRPATTTRTSGPTGGTTGSAAASGSGALGYRLVGSELGDPALTVPLPDAEPLVAAVTQTLVAPASDVGANAAAQALLHLGIGFVVATRPVPGGLAEQLDTTAGLTRLGESGSFALWRVDATTPAAGSAGAAGTVTAQPPARVRVVDAAGRLVQDVPVSGPSARVDTTIPAGAVGRRLILAEPVSPVWRASLSGVRLQPVVSGGLQAFELPPTGGRLTVSSTDNRHRMLQVQGAALVVVALLALPLGRRRRTDEVPG